LIIIVIVVICKDVIIQKHLNMAVLQH
jgi:hypothetical protein